MRVACSAVLLLAAFASAADKSPWIEVRSANFIVTGNAGAKQTRRIAGQFEQIRAVFKSALKMKVDPGKPVIVLALKDEESMRALIPEYWATKGSVHPAGVFFAGTDKHYVILRTDSPGENPFQVLYHEYVHMLVDLNYRSLPLWLNEGLADFYGNSVLGEKEVGLGRPSASALRVLNSVKPMPLALLLTVDHGSPFYNEADKANVFYAESWALVHYLELGRRDRPGLLNAYFQLLQKDMDPVDAAAQAFGDLKALERELDRYAGQTTFYYAKVKAPADVQEETLPVRELSAGETALVQGDFVLRRGRRKEAQAMLEEALRLEPKLAAAHEAMGFFHYQSGDRAAATREFAAAIELDSRNFLVHYYTALQAGPGVDVDEAAREASLRRAIELNPNFAPAHDALAGALMRNDRNKDEALKLITRAVQLEPGATNYWLNLVQVLLDMNRVKEARRLAEKLSAEARNQEEQQRAKMMLRDVEQHEREEAAAVAVRDKVRADSAGPRPRPQPDQPHVEGTVTATICRTPAVLEVYLDSGSKYKSFDFRKLDVFSSVWKPPGDFDVCRQLKGMVVWVFHKPISDARFAGEITALEVKKTP